MKKLCSYDKSKKGFTLVEMVIVIVIVSALVVVSVFGLTKWVKKSKINTDLAIAKNIEDSILSLSRDHEVQDYILRAHTYNNEDGDIANIPTNFLLVWKDDVDIEKDSNGNAVFRFLYNEETQTVSSRDYLFLGSNTVTDSSNGKSIAWNSFKASRNLVAEALDYKLPKSKSGNYYVLRFSLVSKIDKMTNPNKLCSNDNYGIYCDVRLVSNADKFLTSYYNSSSDYQIDNGSPYPTITHYYYAYKDFETDELFNEIVGDN